MSMDDTKSQTIRSLTLAALGVVFGDIGTSPLYAFRLSLHGLDPSATNVLGVLSLIFWALILIISIKYSILLLRADNEGEGGILALMALLKRSKTGRSKLYKIIAVLGVGLMLGDGMLTPAISVISAIEGIQVIAPELSHLVLPITCLILLGLFSIQYMGTEKIGLFFGPILVVWFVTLAILGTTHIVHHPVVLKAINPYYAFHFFHEAGWGSYVVLGGIFLVVTGGETLYADLGHFGRKPMRLAWFSVVLPCLLLNYFGQGANLINDPSSISNPFYLLSPTWFLCPLIFMATLATIVASQAVITATFSLIKQAILLFFHPHLPIIQTSKSHSGQIYIPQINQLVGLGTLLLVLVFQSSSALSHAYGIAINMLMIITSLLMFQVAIKKWRWSRLKVSFAIFFFGSIDLAFLVANINKFFTGGWVPVLFAFCAAFLMLTWNKGITHLHKMHYMKKSKLTTLIEQLNHSSINPLPSKTSIFVTDIYDTGGGNFLRFLKMNGIRPEHIIIVNFLVKNTPHTSLDDPMHITELSKDIYKLTLHYGFMDTISIPDSLDTLNQNGLLPFTIDVKTATYFIEISNVIVSTKHRTPFNYLQEKIFAFLIRHYSVNLNINFYQLPYDRTVAIGVYYAL